MDLLELQTLADELIEDRIVACDAYELAVRRFDAGSPADHDSSAHHLSRFYNVVEQMALRVAKAFENTVDYDKGWHTALIRRLSIPIAGVRPAFFREDLRQPLHELRAFRHVFVHAYELELDPEKLALVLKYGKRVAEILPQLVLEFLTQVARDQGLEAPQLRDGRT